MVSKGFPNVTTSGQQYNIGEKPSVMLYTYINFDAGILFLSLQPILPPKPLTTIIERFRCVQILVLSV